jgi:hypothetical protein
MPESNLHSAFAQRVFNGLDNLLQSLDVGDPGVERLVSFIHTTGTANIEKQGAFTYQPDFAFRRFDAPFPSLVGEVSCSETREHVVDKADYYIRLTNQEINTILVFDLEYPQMTKGWIGVLVAVNGSVYWEKDFELFFDESHKEHPRGEIDLYISDFVGSGGLPAAFCRHKTTKSKPSVSRFVVYAPRQ